MMWTRERVSEECGKGFGEIGVHWQRIGCLGQELKRTLAWNCNLGAGKRIAGAYRRYMGVYVRKAGAYHGQSKPSIPRALDIKRGASACS
jgi:hypothetical protein